MTWKWNIFLLCIIFLLGSALVVKKIHQRNAQVESRQTTWRYVALGDSYSVGEGVILSERWPNQLVERLKEERVDISLVANSGKTGWTTQDVLDFEIADVDRLDANLVSLQIGVNDFIQGQPPEIFRLNVMKILDILIEKPGKDFVFVVTIPDFSITPTGKTFGKEGSLRAGIRAFNLILEDEAKKRDIRVVDIWELSRAAVGSDMFVADGLHPSGKQYGLWVDMMYPMVRTKLY